MELEKLKKHLKVTTERDDELIEDYKSWSIKKIRDWVGMEKEHQEYFEDDENYQHLLVMLVTHRYENPLPSENLNVPSQFTRYGVSDSLFYLIRDYEKWVVNHANKSR